MRLRIGLSALHPRLRGPGGGPGRAVRVRSPQLDTLGGLLSGAGIEATAEPDGSALSVRGAAIEVIGDLAARNGITLHELSTQRASLEEAYLKLTDDAVEYRTAKK